MQRTKIKKNYKTFSKSSPTLRKTSLRPSVLTSKYMTSRKAWVGIEGFIFTRQNSVCLVALLEQFVQICTISSSACPQGLDKKTGLSTGTMVKMHWLAHENTNFNDVNESYSTSNMSGDTHYHCKCLSVFVLWSKLIIYFSFCSVLFSLASLGKRRHL